MEFIFGGIKVCVETVNSTSSKGSTPSISTKIVSDSLKRKKGDKKEHAIVIETSVTATKIPLSKESIKRGKRSFQGVEMVADIEKTLDSRKSKIKGQKILFPPKEVKVTKPRKPFIGSVAQKQILVEENLIEEDLVDEDPVLDEIPTVETLPFLEIKDVVKAKPPSGNKVRFSPEIDNKETFARPMTRSLVRK